MGNSYVYFGVFLAIVLRCISHATSTSFGTTNRSAWTREINVDRNGRGDFKSIQAAIDSISSNNEDWTIIRIEPGIYHEKVVVPKHKSHIILSGRDANTTIITGNRGGGIVKSPIVTILASNFVVKNLTIQNTHKPGIQAVALKVTGDKVAFFSCKFLGYQDTLFDEKGRHYYENCYIEGATDFICGNAASLFENCHIHSISPGIGIGAITAQRRQSWEENTGFHFNKCKITGLHNFTLGRPWGNYSRVVFTHSYMSSALRSEGWNDWDKPHTHNTAYYGEHECHGPGADRSSRVSWSRNLTYDEALPFIWVIDRH